MRIIDKTGPLKNAAERDHCLQYMVAVCLIYGDLRYDHYEDEIAADPRIDRLREKMEVVENLQFTRDYADLEKRSVSNAVRVYFTDGSESDRIVIEYPAGHPRRRSEGVDLVIEKFIRNSASVLSPAVCSELASMLSSPQRLDEMPVEEFMSMLVP